MNSAKISLKSITAKDLWNILKRCYLIVLAVALLVTVVMFVYAKLTYSPVYSSTTTVVLIGESEGEFDVNDFANEYNIAYRIMEECKYLMKTRRVLNAAGEDVGIKNGYGALYNRVVIENPEDTRVFKITATASTPENAKKIADSVAENGIKEIQDVFNYDQLRVFEEGNLNKSPINAVAFTTYLLYGAIAGVVVYAVFMLMFLFDNYIHTEDDIERYLGLSVIGDIPDANYTRRKRYAAYTSEKYAYRSGKKKQSPSDDFQNPPQKRKKG